MTGGKQSQLLVLSLSLKFDKILYVGFTKAKESDKGKTFSGANNFESEKILGPNKFWI